MAGDTLLLYLFVETCVQVEFSMTADGKVASNVILIERHRMRGWIAILRDGKGFIETSGTAANVAPVAFAASSFTDLTAAIELGDEIEFSLSKISDSFTAENILKVQSTIHKFYVSTRCSTAYHIDDIRA